MFFAFSLFRLRWALEASRWPQDGPRRPQERPTGGPRRPHERPRAPQERPNRAPRDDFSASDGRTENENHPFLIEGLQGPPQEAKILQKPKENQCFLPSRFFASDGLLRPQDGPKMAQDSPKRGPRGPQDGPKSAQERSKSGPRGPQDGIFEPPRGRQELEPPLFLINAV